jgi:peptidyl-prolyl cis-trans isomerase C
MIDGIVAVVDEKAILYSDLLKKMHDLGSKEYTQTSARQVLQFMVEDIIVEKVYRSLGLPQVDLRQAQDVAKNMNIDVASGQSMIKRNTLMDLMVKSRVVVTDSMIQDYYNTHKEYAGVESVHLKQILIKNDPEKAQRAIKDIRSGMTFDEAAKAYSDVLAGNTADIGWTGIHELAGEIRTSLEEAKPGDVVGPLSLNGNLLIYQVLERGTAGGKPLEEVRSKIVETLQETYREEAFEHWLKMIMAEHFIGIYL